MIALSAQAWMFIAAAGMCAVLVEVADMVRTRTGRAQEISGAVALAIAICATGALASALGQGYTSGGVAWGAILALGAATITQLGAIARAADLPLRAPVLIGASSALFLLFAALSHSGPAQVAWSLSALASLFIAGRSARDALHGQSPRDVTARNAARRAGAIIGACAAAAVITALFNINDVLGPGLSASVIVALTALITAGGGLLLTLGPARHG